jgi:hypothetical protein
MGALSDRLDAVESRPDDFVHAGVRAVHLGDCGEIGVPAFARERATVRTCDFTAIGIPRHYLAWICEEGLLVKIGYGVYQAVDREAA